MEFEVNEMMFADSDELLSPSQLLFCEDETRLGKSRCLSNRRGYGIIQSESMHCQSASDQSDSASQAVTGHMQRSITSGDILTGKGIKGD